LVSDFLGLMMKLFLERKFWHGSLPVVPEAGCSKFRVFNSQAADLVPPEKAPLQNHKGH
jgi:hypothetical protein